MDPQPAIELGVLGPLRARVGGLEADLGPPQRRTVLAVLICGAPHLIPDERLLECVWGSAAGSATVRSLHVHISRLRKVLGGELVMRHPCGYVLALPPDRLDAHVFSQQVRSARVVLSEGHMGHGRELLVAALSLWRGPAFHEFASEPWARGEIVRLEAERLVALELRLDADVALGDKDVLGELQALVLEHPFHEGFCVRLMVALYRCGRQSEALASARHHRRCVLDAGGCASRPWLTETELRILRHDHRLLRSDWTDTTSRQAFDKKGTSAR